MIVIQQNQLNGKMKISFFFFSDAEYEYFRYEIVDAYRQYTETYLPLRIENYPRELWDNFKGFFKSNEPTEEIDDDNP